MILRKVYPARAGITGLWTYCNYTMYIINRSSWIHHPSEKWKLYWHLCLPWKVTLIPDFVHTVSMLLKVFLISVNNTLFKFCLVLSFMYLERYMSSFLTCFLLIKFICVIDSFLQLYNISFWGYTTIFWEGSWIIYISLLLQMVLLWKLLYMSPVSFKMHVQVWNCCLVVGYV